MVSLDIYEHNPYCLTVQAVTTPTIYRITNGLSWILIFFVMGEAIRQRFSWIFVKSPHQRPKNRYSRLAIHYLISYTSLQADTKQMKTNTIRSFRHSYQGRRILTLNSHVTRMRCAGIITYSQYHGCWRPCDTRSQGISSHDIGLVCTEYSGHQNG